MREIEVCVVVNRDVTCAKAGMPMSRGCVGNLLVEEH